MHQAPGRKNCMETRQLHRISLRNGIGLAAVITLIAGGGISEAQTETTGNANPLTVTSTNPPVAEGQTFGEKLSDLRVGPFDLHPRLATSLVYDDNILLTSTNKEADEEWVIRPSIQAVAGDDAALIKYRDLNYDVLAITPGSLIIQKPEDWPGKFFILDYGPGFQVFDKYSVNNSIDQFGTLDLVWPVNKLILGLKQDYQLQKLEIIEFDRRTTVETIDTALSAAYQFGDLTSMESNFRRISVGYDQTGLTGYTEYNTEDWFNYQLGEELPISAGVLAGADEVGGGENQTYEQLRVRARYNYTEKLAFDASGGAELRQYQNGNPETLKPVFTIAGEYRPTLRSTLRLSAFRQQYAAIFNNYNYTTTGATLEARQGITDRFTAVLSAGFYSLDFTPVAKGLVAYTGDYYIARIALDAKIVRHLTGELYYQYLDSKSQTTSAIGDDQVGLQLVLSY